MNYRDFISEFEVTSLRGVVGKVAVGFLKMEPYWYSAWIQEEIEKALQGEVSEYPLVGAYVKLAEKDDTYVTLNEILVRGTNVIKHYLGLPLRQTRHLHYFFNNFI